MSFSAPRGRISSMEGAPYQGLDSLQPTNRNPALRPTDQWQPRAVIWSIQPNCVSFDAYFYDNDFPNMSDVVWAGSDLTVDLSSPIYFIPHRTEWRSSYIVNIEVCTWSLCTDPWTVLEIVFFSYKMCTHEHGQWTSIMVGCCTCGEGGEWINIEPIQPDTSKWFWGVASCGCTQPSGRGVIIYKCAFSLS